MADVTGLVIGAIALASLFSTCIDLFDRFELGRNYAYDYQLACTKLCLLKTRLSAWGFSLNIGAPGHEHPTLRRHWTEEQEVIGRSLFGIREIFGNAALLAEKYKLTATRSRAFRSVIAHRSKEIAWDAADSAPSTTSDSSWALLRRRTTWAIHDKQKFDTFIQDLSFLIENLEKVTERLGMSQREQGSGGAESPQKLVTSEQIGNPNPGRNGKRAPKVNESLNLHELAPSMNGQVLVGKQEITDTGFGMVGNIGNDGARHIFSGTQTVLQNGFGVMGNVSEEFALKYRQLLAVKQPEETRRDHASVCSRDSTLPGSPTEVPQK